MAAPFPTGSSLSALPLAPNIRDPRLFAADPQAALATAQAGMLLGQELANLENQRAKRALESEQIKLAAQKNKLDQMLIDESARQMPDVVGKIVSIGLQEQQRSAAEKANLAAQAQFWGGMGVGLPAGTGALSGATTFSPPGTMIPEGAGALSGATAAPTGDPAVDAVMNSPGWRLKQEQVKRDREAAASVTREQTAFDRAQNEAKAMLEPYIRAGKVDDVTALYEPGSSTYDVRKVNALVSSLAKTYPQISQAAIPAAAAAQKVAQDALAPYRQVAASEIAEVFDKDTQVYDVPKATELAAKLAEKYPVQAGLIKTAELDDLRRTRRAVEVLKEAGEKIDNLGDPALLDRVLLSMPDPEKARSVFDNVKSTVAAKVTDPNAIARAALIGVLNSQYQSVMNTTTEGRALRNFTPTDPAQSNKALKTTLEIVLPYVERTYEDRLENFPAPVKKYLEKGHTLSQAAAERRKSVDVKSTLLSIPNPQPGATHSVGGATYRFENRNGVMGWAKVPAGQ